MKRPGCPTNAICLLSGEKTTEKHFGLPVKRWRSRIVANSQSRTKPSSPADASIRPSGENASASTLDSCFNIRGGASESTFQTPIVPL